MKHYEVPKIRSIQLDPKQALLHACSVGGIYFNNPVGNYCLKNGAPSASQMLFPTCTSSVRGVTNATTTMAANEDELPS